MQTADVTQDLLQRIQTDQRRCGDVVRPGASETHIAELRRVAKEHFGADLPQGYVDFLRRSDGLDYNGLVVYDCDSSPERRSGAFWQGFVAANDAWRGNEANESLLVFGDSDMELYAYDLHSRTFRRVDKVTHDRHVEFDSFESMIEHALRGRL